MSEPRPPGDVPPDLPPEYAEAYRRGYERAYQEAATGAGDVDEREPAEDVDEGGQVVEDEPEPSRRRPLFADEEVSAEADKPGAGGTEATQAMLLPPAPSTPPRHEGVEPLFADDARRPVGLVETWTDDDGSRDRAERPGWFVPALLGGLVVLLILGAYGIGRVLSSSVGDTDVSTDEPDGVVLGEDGASSESPSGDQSTQAKGRPGDYRGRIEAAAVGGASASCQAPSSVDAAGNEVGYPPTNAYDGDMSTAWRCNGSGIGQTLTLTLPEAVRIGEVGLVPGYAKTDPRSGVDRYAENNRITRVRWTFADGTTTVQRLDGAATNRSLQTMRIRPTRSDTVVVEVLASERGPRNTVAVSEVQIGRTIR